MDNHMAMNEGINDSISSISNFTIYENNSQIHKFEEEYKWRNAEEPLDINYGYGTITVNNLYNFTYKSSIVDIAPLEETFVTIVPLRDLSPDEAKGEILDHIRGLNGQPTYISEIAEILQIDIGLIIQVIEDLEEEGLIEW